MAADLKSPEHKDFRDVRVECYRLVRDLATSKDADRAHVAYALQARVMKEILRAEELLDLKKVEGLGRHIHRLRLCVDAISFLMLHPHTIRQLQKNTGAPPRLMSQREACESALRVTKEHAEQGIACLIADLSNVLRISDVVVCDDVEVPTLIECKANMPSPSLLLKGRKGRQACRAIGTLNYLQHGAAKVIGEEIPRLALDSEVNRVKCQDTIERVLEFGSHLGKWYEFVSPFDLVICVRPRPDAQGVDMEPYIGLFAEFRQPLVGSYAVALWNLQLLIPPAIIWDLDFDVACGLMEEELLLIHVIDLMHFCDIVHDDFRILKVDLKDETKAIESEGDGKRGYASVSFIQWVMYWYFTIESTVEAIREMHALTVKAVLEREHEKAVEVDPEHLSIAVSTGTKSEGNGPSGVKVGDYRVRLDSGDSFTIKPAEELD